MSGKREIRWPGTTASFDPVDFGPDFGTRYIVTVDTEEEFDWEGPFTRAEHGLQHLPYLERFQQFAGKYGIVPIYLIDWPVATHAPTAAKLGLWAAAGEASVGIQLHPWVNPPFEEEVNVHNSYACNLPPALERAKLEGLIAAIREHCGVDPLIYRAGRYGAGPESMKVLAEQGVPFDSSVRARFDYRKQGGPDYSRSPMTPYWMEHGKLAELPLTTLVTGLLGKQGRTRFPHSPKMANVRAALSRTKLMERVALTPEGIPLDKAIKAIDAAIALKLPVLNFSFHSPSLVPGFTPYVRNAGDLDRLYDWWRGVFAHLEMRGAKPVSIEQIRDSVFGRVASAAAA